MICLDDDVRCLVFICSPLLMAIFVLHFILFAEGRLSFLFCVDMWFVLTFVLVQVNAWGVSPWGSPHLFCWDLPTIASTFVSDMACSLVSFSLKCRPSFMLLNSSPFFVSFVCRFSIFLGSLCLEHRLDCNANAPRARQRRAPPPNGRGEISNPVNPLFFRQFRVQSLQLTCSHPLRRSTMI